MQHRADESDSRQPRADSGSPIKVHPCGAIQSGAVAIGKHSFAEYTKHRDFWRWALLVVRFRFDRPKAHYNRERFPLPALACLAQTFGDFEIIVGNDVSTDHRQQICPRGSD